MSGGVPWVKITASMLGIMGVGYVTMKVVTPTPEQLYAKMSPDLRRKVDANRAQRLAAETAVKEQFAAQATLDPDTEKPVWADARR